MTAVDPKFVTDARKIWEDNQGDPDQFPDVMLEVAAALQKAYEAGRMKREKFPENGPMGYKTRASTTIHFTIHTPNLADYERGVDNPRMIELDGYLTMGTYPDGRLGEIFVRMGKQGSNLAWVDEWCLQFSLLIQGGLDSNGDRWTVDRLCRKFAFKTYWPFGGVTGCSQDGITQCMSITDLICKILLSHFGTKKLKKEIEAMGEEQS